MWFYAFHLNCSIRYTTPILVKLDLMNGILNPDSKDSKQYSLHVNSERFTLEPACRKWEI